MYENPRQQIVDINTITWHNLHFILEYYATEVLSTIDKIIVEGEKELPESRSRNEILLQTKKEVISTVKTLKAIHTVLEHHKFITGENQ